ncbi:hypothetical protein LTR97_005628 [Elasticomyces elasticus]|uniref:Uncharacterized protein n=1 Tax=Elasticomyces elasticus TaxID=574655 RepID=A0AAN7ZND1_9PEZI|nr:hypothetical protein LTR97_005628 [Elasticomyces elasticus]
MQFEAQAHILQGLTVIVLSRYNRDRVLRFHLLRFINIYKCYPATIKRRPCIQDTMESSSIQDQVDVTKTDGQQPPNDDTNLTNECELLPPELLQMIVEKQFLGACYLRRYIVHCLEKMAAFDIKRDTDYRSYEQDSLIRREAPYNPQERVYYRARICNFPFASKNFAKYRLTAERDWLKRLPMDLQTFMDFRNGVESGRSELVFELFPQQAFFNPPDAITTIDETDRKHLQTRLTQGLSRASVLSIYIDVLDKKIYEALARLWVAALTDMPFRVKSVKVIAMSPEAQGMMTGLPRFDDDELHKLGVVLQSLAREKEFDYRGLLVMGDTIS